MGNVCFDILSIYSLSRNGIDKIQKLSKAVDYLPNIKHQFKDYRMLIVIRRV